MAVTTRTGTAKRAASTSPPSSPQSAPTPKKLFVQDSDDEYEKDGFDIFGESEENGPASTDSSGGNVRVNEDSSSLTSPSDEEHDGDVAPVVNTESKGKDKESANQPTVQAPSDPVGQVDLDTLDDDPFTSKRSTRLRRGNNGNIPKKGGSTVSGSGKENSGGKVIGTYTVRQQIDNSTGSALDGVHASPAAGPNTDFTNISVPDVHPIPVTNVQATPVILAGDMRGVGVVNGAPAIIPGDGTPVVAPYGTAGFAAPATSNAAPAVPSPAPVPVAGATDAVPAAASNGLAGSVPSASETTASVANGGTVTQPPSNESTVLAPAFVRPDGGQFTNQMKERLRRLSIYAKPVDSTYYIGRQPKQAEWSSGKVKDSCLVERNKVSRLVVWVIGALSWNGMLPNAEGNFPTKPRVSVKPLRNEDLMLFRKIIQDKSCSSKTVDTSNVGSISAHTDTSVRARGADAARASAFPRLYDAQQKYIPDKAGMRQLRPADFLRDDIVLLEVSVGRYWDETANGRVLNWNSNRVYFRLEAVSLLMPGNEEADEEVLEFEAGNHTMAEYI